MSIIKTCRDAQIRTEKSGFGDRRDAISPHPYDAIILGIWESSNWRRNKDYFSFSFSLWSVTFLQCLQYFFSNNFASVFNLFLVVT